MYENNSSYLIHSAKGSHWTKKNHKYIRIENGRYIYKEPTRTGYNHHAGKVDMSYFDRKNQLWDQVWDAWEKYDAFDENGDLKLKGKEKIKYIMELGDLNNKLINEAGHTNGSHVENMTLFSDDSKHLNANSGKQSVSSSKDRNEGKKKDKRRNGRK